MGVRRVAMTARRALLVVVAAWSGAACALRQAESRELCLVPTGDMPRHLESLRDMVAAVDSESVELRRTIGIPTMRASDVVLVRSNTICAPAAGAYRTSEGMPINP